MKVVITEFAKQQIREIAQNIQSAFGKKHRDNFMQKVKEARRLLADNPHLGPKEPLLSDSPRGYRSVVVTKLNKMVYYVDNDTIIYIVDFWDVRREPSTLANQVKD